MMQRKVFYDKRTFSSLTQGLSSTVSSLCASSHQTKNYQPSKHITDTNSNNKICLTQSLHRYFHNNICLNGKSKQVVKFGYLKSQSMNKYVTKFLNGGMNDPKIVWESLGRSGPGTENKTTFFKHGSKTSKHRLQVLNKVFFEAITEIMTNGEVVEKLRGSNVHITKVDVLQELMGIHIYYILLNDDESFIPSTRDNGHDNLDDLLKWAAPVIRQQLCSQRTIGLVPPIFFKKDVDLSQSMAVEKLLMQHRPSERVWQEENDGTIASSEPCVRIPKIRETIKSAQVDIFAADFEYLNTVKVKQEANAALIGTALQTEIFGVNRDRIIAEVELNLKQAKGSNDKYAINDLRVPTFAEDSSVEQPSFCSDAQFSSKTDLKKWASMYTQRLERLDRRESNRANQVELNIIKEQLLSQAEHVDRCEGLDCDDDEFYTST